MDSIDGWTDARIDWLVEELSARQQYSRRESCYLHRNNIVFNGLVSCNRLFGSSGSLLVTSLDGLPCHLSTWRLNSNVFVGTSTTQHVRIIGEDLKRGRTEPWQNIGSQSNSRRSKTMITLILGTGGIVLCCAGEGGLKGAKHALTNIDISQYNKLRNGILRCCYCPCLGRSIETNKKLNTRTVLHQLPPFHVTNAQKSSSSSFGGGTDLDRWLTDWLTDGPKQPNRPTSFLRRIVMVPCWLTAQGPPGGWLWTR